MPDARDIGDSLAARGVRLSLGGIVYDPADPLGKLFFNILATFAEFEVDLLRLRTREGMAIAKAKGKLRASSPSSPAGSRPTGNSTPRRAHHRRVRRLAPTLATVYRALERERLRTTPR